MRETGRLLRRRLSIASRMVAVGATLGLLAASFVVTPMYKGDVQLLLDQRQSNWIWGRVWAPQRWIMRRCKPKLIS